jgi:2-methylcitrate dehydratase PrpD
MVEVESPLGSPEKPLSVEQFEMKFMECARNAVRPLSEDTARAAAHMIRNLEEQRDVSELLRHFV